VNIFSKIREARKKDQIRWEKESFNEEIDTSLKDFLVTFKSNLQRLIDNTATPLEVEEATMKSLRVLGLDKSKYGIVDHVLNSLGKLNWAYEVELIMKEVTDYLAGTSEDTGDPSEAVTCAACGWSGNRSELTFDNKCPKCDSVVIPVSADLPTEKKDTNLVSQVESYAIIVDKVPAIDAGLVKAKECLKILRRDKKHQTYEVLTSSGLPAWITRKSIKKVESVEVGKIYDMDWDGPSKVKVSKINSNGTCSVYRVNKNGERIPGIENQADDVKFSELTKSERLNESGRGKIDDRMKSAEKRVTAKKYGGDDQYSWAVFIDGKPWVTGLSRSEVPYYKKKALAKLSESMNEAADYWLVSMDRSTIGPKTKYYDISPAVDALLEILRDLGYYKYTEKDIFNVGYDDISIGAKSRAEALQLVKDLNKKLPPASSSYKRDYMVKHNAVARHYNDPDYEDPAEDHDDNIIESFDESHFQPGDKVKYGDKDATIISSTGEGESEIYTIEIDGQEIKVKPDELTKSECSKKSESELDSLVTKYGNYRFIKANNINLDALHKDFDNVGCDSNTDVDVCFSKLREKNPERFNYWKSVFKEI